MEIGGGGDGEDVADVAAGGGGGTALVCEHVLYEGLLVWVVVGGGFLGDVVLCRLLCCF